MANTIKKQPASNIDEYIAGFPKNVQQMLEAIRATVKKAAPEAEEAIRYDIPTFRLNGNLVSFGAWKNHIGFYPVPRNAVEFKKELSGYDGEKSTVRFPIGNPLPLSLIGNIVKYQVKRSLNKSGTKDKKPR